MVGVRRTPLSEFEGFNCGSSVSRLLETRLISTQFLMRGAVI